MTDIKVPDIGDFDEVPVIEILVEVGQEVAEEDPLVTLESDKATMDVPAPEAGKVAEILVSIGDKVAEGTPIVRLEGGTTGDAPAQEEPAVEPAEPAEQAEPRGDRVDLVVLGSGPGGYAAAFRAADLGLSVTLVERHERLGGVCLNVGCIPSKTLLHLAKVMAEAEDSAEHGITFGKPEIDLDGVRAFKDGVVKQLTGGLEGLAKRRKVTVVRGEAQFRSDHELQVGDETIAFEHAIIACGSTAATCSSALDGMQPTFRQTPPCVA